jgi:hypothetical protein
MNPFSVVPGFNIFKYCLSGNIEIKVSVMVYFFLLKYGMERFNACIIIGVTFPTKGMDDFF